MTTLPFSKMHSLGNDFMLVLEDPDKKTPTSEQIAKMAHRRNGIGFDQLLWLTPIKSEANSFYLRIFNADGGEAEQCGNGLRCIGLYLHQQLLDASSFWHIYTLAGKVKVWFEKEHHYATELGLPILTPSDIPFSANNKANLYHLDSPWGALEIGAVSLGNPHAVLRVNDLLADDYEQKVIFIAQHERFPHGANVGVCAIENSYCLQLKVYERGVGWTDACGTGACAAVVVAKINHWMNHTTITVKQPGGILTIHWEGNDSIASISGACARVFDGHYHYCD